MAGKTSDVMQDVVSRLSEDQIAAFVTSMLDRASDEQIAALAEQRGLASTSPSLQGFQPEQLALILQQTGRSTAEAMRKSLQKQNDRYPARSVFLPRGLYDDDGNALPPKESFKYDTYHCGVLYGRAKATSDLLTEDTIKLFNRFDKDRDSRGGEWTARIKHVGDRMELHIEHPHRTNDERMGLPDLDTILLELLEGEESVNPSTMIAKQHEMQEQLQSMRAELARLKGTEEAVPA